MAKKIKIEDYEKEVSNKIKKKDKLKMCSLIVNGILGICLIISIVMYVSLYSKSSSKFEETPDSEKKWVAIPFEEYCSYNLDSILKDKTPYYVREKLKFMNDNIVFKIDGFGNYYYSYDCMMEKVNGNFTYWAYNKDAAISEGLKAGGC